MRSDGAEIARVDWFEPNPYGGPALRLWGDRLRLAKMAHSARARAILAMLDSDTLEAIAEAAVDILDERAGDPDLEDGHDAEQDWPAT